MPRDKSENHKKIIDTAYNIFITKGFENTSMRDIGLEVGMTPAGLYRHFKDKEDLFDYYVKPTVIKIEEWKNSLNCDSLNIEDNFNFSRDISVSRFILNEMCQNARDYYLLFFCSKGTKYEAYLHEFIENYTDYMFKAYSKIRENKKSEKMIKYDEMHMIISAYLIALLQPIEHNYTIEDAERYLRTIYEFFLPGWKKIFGF